MVETSVRYQGRLGRHVAHDTGASLPPRPRLVLRIGFAGARRIDGSATHLGRRLQAILETIGLRLAEIAPGSPLAAGAKPPVARWFCQDTPPLLRVVTGLAEGGDTLAARALEAIDPVALTGGTHLERELAAVLPCTATAYRALREASHQPEFDRQFQRCAYVLELDGICEKPPEDPPLARRRRQRAYRAQGRMLLRHADLVIALLDPTAAPKAGGTLETARAALAFGHPLVLLDARSAAVQILQPDDDLDAVLTGSAPEGDTPAWQATLRDIVTMLVADPAIQADGHGSTKPTHASGGAFGASLLREYFEEGAVPPPGSRRPFLRWLWEGFIARLQTGPAPTTDAALPALARWRRRSTALSYHYAGIYRGAFLANAALAFGAVLLATVSLALLAWTAAVHGPQACPPLYPVLLVLGAMKLAAVATIYRNTHAANQGLWSDRAVDHRYAAERLRALQYLPQVGSLHPPFAHPSTFASRALHQSAIDWLVEAIQRALPPAELAQAMPCPDGEDSAEGTCRPLVLRPDTAKALATTRSAWIEQQAIYHERNARTMGRLFEGLERWGRRLNLAVIAIVFVDVSALAAKSLHMVPAPAAAVLAGATPWLLFLAALLPAAVAGLNGIRFQSECRRLADRSAVMRTLLRGSPPDADGQAAAAGGHAHRVDHLLRQVLAARDDPTTDPGSWTLEAVGALDAVARDGIHEVAEWSVLYAREVVEP